MTKMQNAKSQTHAEGKQQAKTNQIEIIKHGNHVTIHLKGEKPIITFFDTLVEIDETEKNHLMIRNKKTHNMIADLWIDYNQLVIL